MGGCSAPPALLSGTLNVTITPVTFASVAAASGRQLAVPVGAPRSLVEIGKAWYVIEQPVASDGPTRRWAGCVLPTRRPHEEIVSSMSIDGVAIDYL